MLRSWVESIQFDLQTAEIMHDTAEFDLYLNQCIHIIVKVFQHFIYCKTQIFPDDNDFMLLFHKCVQLDSKVEAYSTGMEEIQKTLQSKIPPHCISYPAGTTRKHYLDFCVEFFNFILKRLKKGN